MGSPNARAALTRQSARAAYIARARQHGSKEDSRNVSLEANASAQPWPIGFPPERAVCTRRPLGAAHNARAEGHALPTGKSSPGRHGRQGGPLALTDWPANVTCRLYAPVVWRAEATVIPAIETIGTSSCWPGNSNGPPAATDWAPHFTCGPRAPSLLDAAHSSRAREWGALSCPRPKIAMSARELGWAPSGDGMGLQSAQRRIRGRARARSPARSGFCIALIRKVAMVAWKLTRGPCAVAYGGPNLPCGLHAPTFRRDVRRARARPELHGHKPHVRFEIQSTTTRGSFHIPTQHLNLF